MIIQKSTKLGTNSIVGIFAVLAVFGLFAACKQLTLPGTMQRFFSVTFESNGGAEVAKQTVLNGGKINEPRIINKEDYIFEGWFRDDETFEEPWDFGESVTEDITLYAKWIKWISPDESDFGSSVIHKTFNVATTSEWNSAVSAITSGDNNKNYIINVIDSFTVAGRTTNNFGNTSGIRVSIRGNGHTLYLSSNGNILRIGANQTVILRELTLRGNSNNNNLVYVRGIFIMHSGEISGNAVSASAYSSVYGSGVYVVNGGSFTMTGGKISGNSISATGNYSYAWGGGVYIATGGTFIMNGGEISGNAASASSTINSRGGGVYASGTIRISAGIIYGSDEAEGIKNTANNGAALYKGTTSGIAQYGTFSGNEWISGGNLNTTNNTIWVTNGELQTD
jgi:uncharacterized repeat protein (TIGR02543 family)